ncbi:YheC/YheD family protein [Alteribacter populi]|uniref:YheC/YheD family endospore coat-associated protein n=1 Tax=Alteribacter populi TaxID=2011011 RepID=UPI000BBB1FF5|nr:YheC/YheD family protein [Alteribacter populi]
MANNQLGIFVTHNIIRKMLDQSAPDRDMDIVRANEGFGMNMIYFSRKDIDYEKNRVLGTYFNQNQKKWEQREFSFPTLLYRRVGGLKKTQNKKLQAFLRKNNVRFVNYIDGFNKWEMYQVLSKNSSLNVHLPNTKLYRNPIDLSVMIAKYKHVYLKGVKGGKGRQVMSVKKVGRSYECCYFRKRLRRIRLRHFHLLIRKIKQFYKGQPFIIQQPIQLLKLKGRLLDIRAEVQRDGKNNLQVVGECMRWGNARSPITTHANSYPLETFLRKNLRYREKDVKRLQKKIKRVVTNVSRELDLKYGSVGEIGVDLGLDRRGRLWLIECNSRSSKVSLEKAYGREKRREAYKMLLAYTQRMLKGGTV